MQQQNPRGAHLVKTVRLVLICLFVVYAGYQVFVIANARSAPMGDSSTLIVTLLQALAGVAFVLVPEGLRRLHWIDMKAGLELAYFVFLFLALFLGTLMRFFVEVSFWDTFTHAIASALGAFFLYCVWEAVVTTWSGQLAVNGKRASVVGKPAVTAPWEHSLLGYGFALGVTALGGVLWEIYEFSVDAILPTQNLQRYATLGGTLLEGRAALMDTMVDLIWDLLGATLALVAVYVVRRKSGKLNQVRFHP